MHLKKSFSSHFTQHNTFFKIILTASRHVEHEWSGPRFSYGCVKSITYNMLSFVRSAFFVRSPNNSSSFCGTSARAQKLQKLRQGKARVGRLRRRDSQSATCARRVWMRVAMLKLKNCV